MIELYIICNYDIIINIMKNSVYSEIASPEYQQSLESALYESFPKIFRYVERQNVLRHPVCDLTSMALAYHLRYKGIDAGLVKSTSESLPGVIVDHYMVGTSDGDIIDPTHYQFLALIGYRPQSYKNIERAIAGTSKIAILTQGDSSDVIETHVAIEKMYHPLTAKREGLGRFEIRDREPDEFRQVLTGIWDPANIEVTRPDESLRRLGAVVAGRMIA